MLCFGSFRRHAVNNMVLCSLARACTMLQDGIDYLDFEDYYQDLCRSARNKPPREKDEHKGVETQPLRYYEYAEDAWPIENMKRNAGYNYTMNRINMIKDNYKKIGTLLGAYKVKTNSLIEKWKETVGRTNFPHLLDKMPEPRILQLISEISKSLNLVHDSAMFTRCILVPNLILVKEAKTRSSNLQRGFDSYIAHITSVLDASIWMFATTLSYFESSVAQFRNSSAEDRENLALFNFVQYRLESYSESATGHYGTDIRRKMLHQLNGVANLHNIISVAAKRYFTASSSPMTPEPTLRAVYYRGFFAPSIFYLITLYIMDAIPHHETAQTPPQNCFYKFKQNISEDSPFGKWIKALHASGKKYLYIATPRELNTVCSNFGSVLFTVNSTFIVNKCVKTIFSYCVFRFIKFFELLSCTSEFQHFKQLDMPEHIARMFYQIIFGQPESLRPLCPPDYFNILSFLLDLQIILMYTNTSDKPTIYKSTNQAQAFNSLLNTYSSSTLEAGVLGRVDHRVIQHMANVFFSTILSFCDTASSSFKTAFFKCNSQIIGSFRCKTLKNSLLTKIQHCRTTNPVGVVLIAKEVGSWKTFLFDK